MIVQHIRWLAVAGMMGVLGCALFTAEPEKMDVESDYNTAFDRVREVIGSRFRIKSADRKKGKLRTEWKEYPSDVLTKRKRLFATVRDPEGVENTIRITLLSEVQTVESGMKTYQTNQASWDDAGRDRGLERTLLKLIRFNLTSDEVERNILDKVERNQERERRLRELKEEEERNE